MKSSIMHTTFVCLSLLAVTACSHKKDSPQKPPPPQVGVITAQSATAPLTKDLVGRLSSYRSADVRARVSGVLLARTYDEGSDVKKGQVLFKIDPAPLKASLDSAQAALAQAQATYTNNKITAQRSHSLAPKGYISKAALDTADANERTSAGAVQAARANVETARINLGYATVRSPIDGRAGQQQVTEGALVGQGEATLLTTVDQIDPLYVNFTISASELEEMRQGQRSGDVTLAGPNKASVQVTLPDGSSYAHAGTLDFSAASVDPSTSAVTLRAKIPNPEHSLLPGLFVTIKANMGEQHHIFRIPQQAVQRDTIGAFVDVIGKDGNVARKDVRTVMMNKSDWIIDSGLASGDQVVVSGLQQIKAGEPAKGEPWQPKQDASSTSSSQAPSAGSATEPSKPASSGSAGKQ